jgi:trimeric autotransporter adhesin
MKKTILPSIGILLIFSVYVCAEQIMSGEYKTGQIAGLFKWDNYTFDANAGDVVTILIGETTDYGGFNPMIELIDPSGTNIIAFNSGPKTAVINAQKLTQSGIYTIMAHAEGFLTSGKYGLSFIKNPGTVFNEPEDGSVQILSGQYKSGYLAKGDLDGYTFDANIGDFITIFIGELADEGGFDPQVELIEPNGTRTSAYGTSSAAISNRKINQSGTYTIIAREKDGYQTGFYGLSMLNNRGLDVNDQGDAPTTILPGEYKTGLIDKGDLDGYTFDANAGDIVSILMGTVTDYSGGSSSSSIFTPQVELIEPDGIRTSVYNSYSTTASINAKKLRLSGRYLIITRAGSGNYAAEYSLCLMKNPGTVVNEPGDDTVQILPGQYKTGLIDKGDLDGYTFNANAGDVVNISMYLSSNNSDFVPKVEMIAPDGTRTVSPSGSSSTTSSITNKNITISGTYLIIARDYNDTSDGTYTLTMQKTGTTL